MEELQRKIDAVMRLATANTDEERNTALEEVRCLLKTPCTPALDVEDIIQGILLELGAPDHLMGYPMVIKAVMLVIESPDYLKPGFVTRKLYPKVAEAFGETAGNTERVIRHLIETTWMRGDPDAQYRLFGNTINPDKCKPTNSQFISRIANIARMRVKTA